MIPVALVARPKAPLMKGGRFATLPGEASRCGGLRADRVARPYKDFYKIHSMHTRPCRSKYIIKQYQKRTIRER